MHKKHNLLTLKLLSHYINFEVLFDQVNSSPIMWYFYCVVLPVNVDEWMKSANSLSPNDMEAGEFFLDAIIIL